MISEAKRLGNVYKSKREELNLSLREVESSTSIRANYLEAIEEGNIESFLSNVYMYGFMRQYAVFLELDLETLAREHEEAFKPPQSEHEFSYGLGSIEMRKGTLSKPWWHSNWAMIAGSFGAFILAYMLVKFLGIL